MNSLLTSIVLWHAALLCLRSSNAWTSQHAQSHRNIRGRTSLLWMDSQQDTSASNDDDPSCSYRMLILRHGQTDANAGGIIQGSSDFSRLTKFGKQQARDVAVHCFAAPANDVLNNIDNDIDDMHNNMAAQSCWDALDSVYVSPLSRAQQTYQTLCASQVEDGGSSASNPITLDNLREIDLYGWQNRHKEELGRIFPKSYQAWKNADPELFIVQDTCHETGVTTDRYPLLKLWDRAEQVWDDIRQIERKQQSDDAAKKRPKIVLLVCHGSLSQALLGTAMGWDATFFRKFGFPNCGLAEVQWNDFLQGDGNTLESRAENWRFGWPQEGKTEWKNRKESLESSK